ncbi:ATP-dependent DNA helicase [Homoserinibacter sp. GY 40078]|uniref:ATP-dependent DNA helicase n=1 Tax=Homoserinibacter sp. GY 40078 TaxID=2603275 RepID=UPI0011C85764|nr:ATP-dependent DNA helicase [Homoserinibacter sp. GY 40078]TXK19620.1 ATP-dependent helicase [Homoserinibacter sp. GY 40078]
MSARFVVDAVDAVAPVALDPSQAAVLALPDGASAAVLGAPGSGKTTTIVELVADRISRGWTPEQLLVLAPSRAAATLLRDRLARRIAVPTDGPLARTVPSLAFELAGAAARLAGRPAPRLLTGTELDADIAAYLEGHVADGSGPNWPDPLSPAVRELRGFRSELRELMARATEYGATPDDVARLAREAGRPEWVAAAEFWREYQALQASNRPDQFDAAEFVRFAVRAIREGGDDDRVARLRLVVVDDLQEATESTMAVLRALVDRGVQVIAFGDPDVAANAFRGGEADAVGRFATALGRNATAPLVLETVHRGGAELRALVGRVVERIGTAAAGPQRRASVATPTSTTSTGGRAVAEPSREPDVARPPIASIRATTPARHAAAIARVLREEHLLSGVPWNRLAVVVRSGAQIPELARALARAEVPTRATGRGTPLRDDLAPRALLAFVEVGIGRRELDPETAAELLIGPFGGLDPLGLRRLRLALRHEELAGGGIRPGAELVAEALAEPGRFATIEGRAARRAARVAETLHLLRGMASDSTVEELLWTVWEKSGVGERWRRAALGSGIEASEANRDLDGVVALFSAAKRFVEHRPTEGALEFLEHVLDSDIADDLLAPPRADDAVVVATPSALVGLEFRTVVVASLQDGAWPNLRPRGSLLAPQRLVRVLEHRDADAIDERKLVLDDELRMFALAVSRASDRVVLAAVDNDDETASVLFSLAPDAVPIASAQPAPLTLRGLTGRLRRELADPAAAPARRRDAASTLATLAVEGLPGADPSGWLGLAEPSTDEPLFAGNEVRVSPSQLANLEESPLDWAVSRLAGGRASIAMNLGTIVHWAMETADGHDVDALWARVEERWPELPFDAEWISAFQRRATLGLIRALAEYLGDFDRDGKTLVAAEGRFTLPIAEGVVASGSIDRVELAPGGEVVIVDLKTGNPETSAAVIAAHPQLASYQLAYRDGVLDPFLEPHGEHRAGGAKLVFVKSGVRGKLYREGVQVVLDDDALDAFRERLAAAAALMAAASFDGPREAREFRGRTDPDSLLPRVPEVTHD